MDTRTAATAAPTTKPNDEPTIWRVDDNTVGGAPAPAGDRQAARETGATAPGRPADLRRADLAGPERRPMGDPAPAVRGQIDGPRALPGVGRTWLPGAGVGATPRGVRRRGPARLAVASRRRVPGAGPARQKRGSGEAEATGANPTDRGKCGVKRHLLTDGTGVPLATVLSGANRPDMKKLADLLDARVYAAPALGEQHLCLDRGYDYAACRETAAAGATPRTSRPGPARRSPCRRPAIPRATRRAAGSSRSRTVGSTASGGC